jgi:hypothetical protein
MIHSKALANKMTARRDENVFIAEVGDLLIDSAPTFNVYSTYASNYPSAMKLVHSLQLRPDMKENFQKWMNAPEARGLSLESFLIKPVQRICKYPLLIRVCDLLLIPGIGKIQRASWKSKRQGPSSSGCRKNRGCCV